jgi:hypothetical protein
MSDRDQTAEHAPRTGTAEMLERIVGRAVSQAMQQYFPQHAGDIEPMAGRAMRDAGMVAMKEDARRVVTVADVNCVIEAQNDHLLESLRRVVEVADRLAGGEPRDGACADLPPATSMLDRTRQLQDVQWRLLHEISHQVGRLEQVVADGARIGRER